jgi:hypothetical protein
VASTLWPSQKTDVVNESLERRERRNWCEMQDVQLVEIVHPMHPGLLGDDARRLDQCRSQCDPLYEEKSLEAEL